MIFSNPVSIISQTADIGTVPASAVVTASVSLVPGNPRYRFNWITFITFRKWHDGQHYRLELKWSVTGLRKWEVWHPHVVTWVWQTLHWTILNVRSLH